MKVIIAGSRTVGDFRIVAQAVFDAGFTIAEVVSGTAAGVDRLGEQWAEVFGIPVKRFPANWERDGRAAGMMRNRRMAEYADGLIAVWDGVSKGTKQMIDEAWKRNLRVHVHRV